MKKVRNDFYSAHYRRLLSLFYLHRWETTWYFNGTWNNTFHVVGIISEKHHTSDQKTSFKCTFQKRSPSNSEKTQTCWAPNSWPGVRHFISLSLKNLKTIWMTELVYESLRSFCLFHDTLFVILSYWSTQFIVIHRWPVLAFTPKTCDAYWIFNLEDSFRSIQPTNATPINLGLRQQLF